MRFRSEAGEQRYAALVRAAERTVVGLDFDGTLAPIVDDPTRAAIHPDAADALLGLAPHVASVAVITGRPVRQVLALGGLEAVGEGFEHAGRVLHVFGQYGHEEWSSRTREVATPPPAPGLLAFASALPSALGSAHAADAYVEDKGLAVAVHTRRLPDPAAAFDRLLPVLSALAETYGLAVEPGRSVVEVRSPGMHKGLVVERLADELGAGGFLFAGDDLGDVEAFEAVEALDRRGLATLRVCSASAEETALVELADLVVDGPGGIVDLLRQLTADAARSF